MAESDKDTRTELPTGKRLGEAREKGQLAISREVVSWVSMLSIVVVIAWFGPNMTETMVNALRIFIEAPQSISLNDQGLQTVLYKAAGSIAVAVGLVFLVLAAAPIIGYMSQTGLYASTQLIKPDFMRLNPAGGFKKLFSVNSLVELVKSFGKLVVLGSTVGFILWPLIYELPKFIGLPMLGTIQFIQQQAIHMIVMLLLVFTTIALGDLFYQRYSYIQNLKMTKAEVKDEFKQQEGDPIVKGRLRQIRIEKARKRMMANVPKADVVITNPTHYAIALAYDSGKMVAPTVLAKGVDRIAERIREVAAENKIPFVSNPPLARALYDTVEVDEEIPTQHYRAVAEIVSYVYKLKKRKF